VLNVFFDAATDNHDTPGAMEALSIIFLFRQAQYDVE